MLLNSNKISSENPTQISAFVARCVSFIGFYFSARTPKVTHREEMKVNEEIKLKNKSVRTFFVVDNFGLGAVKKRGRGESKQKINELPKPHKS